MKVSDIVSILTAVAGLSAAISEPALEAVFPGHGSYIAGVLALSGIVATAIIRTLSNKTGAPAQAIAANAAIVPPDTTVVTASTPVVATNVSTTSTLLPKPAEVMPPQELKP
jgi:hypothetical protein